MSELQLVAGTGGDLPSQQIARRVRGKMAEAQVTGRQMASALGMDQAAMSRRYRGDVAWSIDQLAMVSDLLGVPFAELVEIKPASEKAAPGGGTAFLPPEGGARLEGIEPPTF